MKKIIKVGTILLIVTGILYFSIFYIQNITLKNSYSKEFNEDFKKNNTYFIRCDLNIFQPEFAFVSEIGGGLISFEKSENMFYQIEDEWERNEIGGTTISNATFPQLIKMVKTDCYQFQKPKGQHTDTTINWRWVTAPTEEERLENEQEKKRQEELYQKEIEVWNNLSEEEKEKKREEERMHQKAVKEFEIPTDEELEEMGL
jgi:hypothetical protein